MRTIIAATDFSAASVNAANYAADMAVSIDAELILFHLIQMPVSFDVPLTQYEFDCLLQDAEDELERLKYTLSLRTQNELTISTKAAFSSMALEMSEMWKNKKPFLIVIGQEKENLAERLFFGSNIFTIVKNLNYPVIVVPQNAVYRHIKHIGLATDLNNIEQLPIDALSDVVEMFDASLDIVHVSNKPMQDVKDDARISLVQNRLKDLNPNFYFILNDNVEQGLNDYASRHREDLLVMIPKVHNKLGSLIHKSHSEKMAVSPSVPVLAISGYPVEAE